MKLMHAATTVARKPILALAFAWLANTAISAIAAEPALKSHLIANRVETQASGEVFKPANKAAPGDLLKYRARYVNKGPTPVAALSATIPIPPGTEYRPGSARPADALASADGINFAAMPLKRTARAPAGKVREENVPYGEYRALRWDLGALPGGKDATVSLRVSVGGVPTSVAK